MQGVRHLVVVLGDQLNRDAAAFDGFLKERDALWMAEVRDESAHVPSHKARSTLFLSAMRHFAAERRAEGIRVEYQKLRAGSLAEALQEALLSLRPERVVMTEAGDYRVEEALKDACARAGVPLELRPDRHFLCSRREFAEYVRGRKQLRLEYFYREMRRRHDVLMEEGEPVAGRWNFDEENRRSFGRNGPGLLSAPARYEPDAVTRAVMEEVERELPGNPGSLANFDWPVTRRQALEALDDFISHRLPEFGRYQDAMWTGEPWLYHSRLSAALNLKLLAPREVIGAAASAWREGRAPLESAEGFIRQILGWREYVRGIYWTYMPAYAEGNALEAHTELPEFYWTGETDMRCLREAIGQTLTHGYAHHIQRLMITGLYALLAGVEPRQIHEWYLAVYVDAVEWVELPNTIGMSQFADGGLMASKPYAATGKYIQRMSNYCAGCRYDPAESTGERACPFTTLYWDFLMRNETRLKKVGRMDLQLRNLARLTPPKRAAIQEQAARLRGKKAGAWA